MIIYAKQVNPEYQISPIFKNGFLANSVDFAFLGNKDYHEIVPAHMRDVIYYLDSYDIESVEDINSYFPGARKETENKILLELCKEYQNNNDLLNRIEIEYFNYGTQWIIENGKNKGDSIYCISLDFDNIKKEIRKQLQLESNDIIILKTFTTTKCIKYVEV